MPNAQNGWPVVPASHCADLTVAGVTFPNGVLGGDVAYLFTDLATLWHKRVEPLIGGHCWGYAHRKIGSGTTWSNHAAGCAIDINAPEHPDNTHPSKTLTAKQIREIHDIEARYLGVIRWGGDWSDPDPMHWEIVGDPDDVRTVAAKLRGEPELSRGATGIYVKKCQRWANQVPGTGDLVKEDSRFGPLTEAKIRRIQRKAGLKDDGICGPKTWAYMKRWVA